MGRPVARSALSLTLLALAGCGRQARPAAAAPAPRAAPGAVEEGIASWYGRPYHGRRTSSGEVYDMDEMTAAHRTLPLGARVRVANLSNGREAEVTINDRGPFVKDRIIDLSRAAARRIEMIGPGTARVRLTVIGQPPTPAGGFYAVQVGSFRNRRNAERLREQLERQHGAARVHNFDSPDGRFYRVLAGRQHDTAGAATLAAKLEAQGLAGFVVRVDQD